jgi:hypothetical protein
MSFLLGIVCLKRGTGRRSEGRDDHVLLLTISILALEGPIKCSNLRGWWTDSVKDAFAEPSGGVASLE